MRAAAWPSSPLALVLALGCVDAVDGGSAPPRSSVGASEPALITPAPEHLRGRVALPSGARLYARPDYSSASWELRLPAPPLLDAGAPARARAFRVIGVVTDPYASDFLAITNDLAAAESDADERLDPGCGQPLAELPHLRLLLFVPLLHLAEVTTRSLELDALSAEGEPQRLRIAAGARVGSTELAGLPLSAPGSSWRWVDADGIRALAPVPDEAVGRAWQPGAPLPSRDAGEQLMRDPEGSLMWLRDEGGASVELSLRNACAERWREVVEPDEVETLRALALELFYDQSPPPEPPPTPAPSADYRIAANTPLRWPEGELAGEVLRPWLVEVGVGQTWNDRRCFSLQLGSELVPLERAPLACVKPDALELLAADGGGFAASSQLELGGSVELGPAEPLSGDWNELALRELLNARHESSAECLRPLLLTQHGLAGARWQLELRVEGGSVAAVSLTAEGPSSDAVEDCLEAEAYTWYFPRGEGQLRVPLTLSELEPASEPEPASEASEPDTREPPTSSGESSEPEPERGRVIIIRDDE